jgi:hypothetical protein
MLGYQLLRPLFYLTIKDGAKWKIDFLVPLAASLLTLAGIFVWPLRPQLFMANGLVTQVLGLLQIMPGFYLAALAAIATFNKVDMDSYMPSPTPTVRITIKGQSLPIKLTRRRMLSLQFGYLTFISLLLFISAIGANALAPSVKIVLSPTYHASAVGLFVCFFAFMFWHMISVTMFGLYQLSDRMHQPDEQPGGDPPA